MKRTLLLFLRNAKNNPVLFAVNLVGFSIGAIAALFIYLYVFKELTTDRFHTKRSDLYRVVESYSGSNVKRSNTRFFVGEMLKSRFPDVQDYVRIAGQSKYVYSVNEKEFYDLNTWGVNKSFFTLLDFELTSGDYKQLYENPNTIVVSKEIATRFFGANDPLGKQIEISDPSDENKKGNLTIAGVLKDYPEESTLKPQIIAGVGNELLSNKEFWAQSPGQLFLYMPNSSNKVQIASQIPELVASVPGVAMDANSTIYELQPFTDLYLHSSDISDSLVKGDSKLLVLLVIIGFALLFIVTINYIILSLGINSKNKIYGKIHFVLGGGRWSLAKKIIGHSVIFSVFVFMTILIFYPLIYKVVANFSNYRYGIFSNSDVLIFASFFFILIVFGILTGLLQTLIAGKFNIHKNQLIPVNKKQWFFKELIQFQIAVFIIFFVSLVFINRQMNLIRSSDVGFDIKNSFTISFLEENDLEVFKSEFENQAYIKSIALGDQLYKSDFDLYPVLLVNSDNKIEAQIIQGDQNYIDSYNIKLLSGQNLNGEIIPDRKDFFYAKRDSNVIVEVLVNEGFVQKAGLDNPIGTELKIDKIYSSFNARIVGIIGNVKNLPFYYKSSPMVIGYDPNTYTASLIVSVSEGYKNQFQTDVNNFFITRKMGAYLDLLTWNYDFNNEYLKEQTLKKFINTISAIIFGVMILGLVGLSLFISESKTKEIGIRKVNGAKVSEILAMLNKDFVKWVVIAFVIATPVAWYAMNKWLESFAYKTTLSWWIFALAGLLALGIALLTVSWQSWRAATRNPLEALRYE